jgi:putative ABC transport system permease protein
MLNYFLKRIFSGFRHGSERSLLTIVSMAIGLAVFCLIYLHVKQELRHDHVWPDSQAVYRLLEESIAGSFTMPILVEPRSAPLNKYLDGTAELLARTNPSNIPVFYGDYSKQLSIYAVEPSFLDIFKFEVLEGDLTLAIQEPGLIALEEEQAKQLFNTTKSVLGLSITTKGSIGYSLVNGVASPVTGEDLEFKVAAVYRLPRPISEATQFDALIMKGGYSEKLFPFPRMAPSITWMKLPPGYKPQSLQPTFEAYVNQYYGIVPIPLGPNQQFSDLFKLRLERLHDIYLHSPVPARNHGNLSRLITLLAVGLLVLLAAFTNALCISLSAVPEHTKEVGILKSLGAEGRHIALQFLGKPIILSLLALAAALGITSLIHSVFAKLLSIEDLPSLSGMDLMALTGFSLLLGIVMGFYPAFVLARHKPMRNLKLPAVLAQRGRWSFRTISIFGQYAVAVFLIITALAIYIQLQITAAQPLGFNPSQFLTVYGSSANASQNAEIMVNELERIPAIEMVKAGGSLPRSRKAAIVADPAALVRSTEQSDGINVEPKETGFDIFKLLQISLLAGREFNETQDFRDASQAQNQQQAEKIIINRQSALRLGFANPNEALGEFFYLRTSSRSNVTHTPVVVIGVVEDSMYFDLTTKPASEIYRQPRIQGAPYVTILVRYDPHKAAGLQQNIIESWLKIYGQLPNEINFLDDYIRATYASQRQEANLILICAGIALLLATLGLYGAVSIAMKSSLKEIGVRKVLGGGAFSILLVFLRRFSNPLLFSSLLAWPLAVMFILRWIENFPYQLAKPWLFPLCVLATGLVTLISWTTVAWMSNKVARIKAVKCLRYE